MKIGIYSPVEPLGHSGRGIGNYIVNLIEALSRRHDLEVVEFKNSAKLPEVDLIHYPFFDFFDRTLPLIKSLPTVVTIHDVTPLLFPEHYPPGIRGRINLAFQKQSLKSVGAIITDSKVSKKDITSVLKVSEEKIFVTYLSAAKDFKVIEDKKVLTDIKTKYNLPEKFGLFIGNVNWNKNILNLARACAQAHLPLVLVGKSFEQRDNLKHPEMRSFTQFLKEFKGNPLVLMLGFVPTADLVGILNLASVFLFPSFYEGFGMPVLEAQACRVPVITSNRASLPEVAGGGALFVDPYSVEEIARMITKLLSDQALQKDLIKKGVENFHKFSWEKTAEETVLAYRFVLRI